MTPVALTIAGSDPSGGAGIQADLKTFHRCGVYGEAVVTLITVQNTQRLSQVHVLSPDLVRAQIEALIEDIPPAACKTGALGDSGMIAMLADLAKSFTFPLIVDPVLFSKHGAPLASGSLEHLLPLAALVTPNLEEAAVLSGVPVNNERGMRRAAEAIHARGAKAVLIKGGHLNGPPLDILFDRGCWYEFTAERIDTPHTHGTGCTYSAAITAQLANGFTLPEAVGQAKRYVTDAIRTAPGLGRGQGPLNHFA